MNEPRSHLRRSAVVCLTATVMVAGLVGGFAPAAGASPVEEGTTTTTAIVVESTTTTTAVPVESTTTTTAAPVESTTTTTAEVPPTERSTAALAAEPMTIDGTVNITGGYLDWGVRGSFLKYIKSPIAAGSAVASGGAIDNTASDKTFRFPAKAQGTFDGETNGTDASFEGEVHFTGHKSGGVDLLDIRVTNLRIVRNASGSSLIADVVSRAFNPDDLKNPTPGDPLPPVTYIGIPLVNLNFAGLLPTAADEDGLTWSRVPATMGTEGAVAFGGFYPAGDTMDPVTYTLTLSEVPDVPLDPDGPDGPRATLDRTQVRPGDTLTVSGTGFLAGEQVEVWLFSEPTWVGTATADSAGAVSFSFLVPTDTPAGVHHLELRGISSSYTLESGEFTVLAADGAAGGSGTGKSSGSSKGGATLPATGASLGLAGVGAALVLAGGVLAAGARRRKYAGS